MIQSIRLQNFRSYTDESFEFDPGVTIVVGPNGSGKTNLLEALLMVSVGSSFRVGDEDMIQFDKPWARLDVATDNHSRTVKLMREGMRTSKSYVFDEKPYKLLRLNHTLPVVLFEPNHLLLLHGQPELRRTYLDALLEQTRPDYAALRKHYKRALAQRNALLKSAKSPSKEQLFIWNLRMSELGGVIAKARVELITNIEDNLDSLYNNISSDKSTKVSIRYISKLPADNYETALLKALEKSYDQDVHRGFTSYGPHRDDFVVLYDQRPAIEVASRGETRTALLALKIFELGMIEKIRNQKPLLLLDDVFSELDGKRRHALASFLQTHQTFITTTDADLVLDEHMKSSHVIPLTK
jgi:DNA replication and repair protein RecF